MSHAIVRSYFIVFILLLFCASQSVAAQEQQEGTGGGQVQVSQETMGTAPVNLNMDYFKGYLTDTGDIVTAPARWDSTDWLKAGVITGVAAGLFIEDDQIQQWVQRHKNNTTSDIADDVKKTATYSAIAAGGLGAYGFIANDERAKTTFLLSAESFIITGAFVQVLKYSTGRARPYTGHNHDYWNGPSLSNGHDYQSFPSGDDSSAFAIASVIASEYDNMVIKPLVYTISTAIALERVHDNAHWSSDVFVGGVIGYFTGKSIVASHRDRGENRLSFSPIMDGSTKGMIVTFRY